MRRAHIWSKKAKTEHERLKREIVDRKTKARSDSENRQERIKVIWGLEEQDLKATTYKERKLNEQKLKEQKLKKVLNCIKDSAENDELADQVGELVELAGLQDREIEYLMQFLRNWELMQAHYPKELENLYSASLRALMWQALPYLPEPNLKPKTEWDRKRRGHYKLPGGVGLIEYEFGGAGEAQWYKWTHGLSATGEPYQPTCLDNIFRGGVGEVKMLPSFIGQPPIPVDTVTNMRRLEALFGMHRNGFPKKLQPRRMGREIVYDWCAVVKIMDALLSEPRNRTRLARGRPRQLWLSDPALRARVLSGIEVRLKMLSAPEHIQAAFLAIVRPLSARFG